MKRTRSIFLAIALLCAPLSFASTVSFTLVTGTVVDPNGLAYANGTITATLVISGSPVFGGAAQGVPTPPANTPYTPPTQPVGLDKTGSFTMQLADNNALLPSGSQWNFQVCSAVGTIQPAGGKGPVCFTLASPITITGTTQSISTNLNAVAPALSNIAGGGGGGTVSPGTAGQIASYLANGSTISGTNKLIGVINPEAYGVVHDVQVIYDATWATGCAGVCTITSGAGDPCFVAGDVGKIEFGTNWTATNQFYQASTVVLPQGTVSSFTDCHHIVVNTTPTANATATGVFAWGHDDATALAAAWTAATVGPQCQELLLPSGTMFSSTGQFTSAPNCKFPSDASGDTGSSVGGVANGGLRSTVIIPLPSLSTTNSATCNGSGGACFGGIAGLNMHDFSIFGMGNGATGFPSGKACLSHLIDDYFSHIECSWWGQSDSNFTGLLGSGGPDLFRVVINGAGSTNCHFTTSVQLWASYCNAGLTTVMIADAGTVITSFVSGYGASGTTQPTTIGWNQISGTFRSYGDLFFSSGGNNHLVQVFNGGTIYMDGSTISQGSFTGTAALRVGNGAGDTANAYINGSVIKTTGTPTAFALVLNGGGVRAVSRDSTYTAPSGGNQILNANGAVYQDMGGNSFTGAATIGLVGAGQWQGIQGITAVQGSASGTCASSSTLGLYGAGQTTTPACTSTTVTAGQVMTKNGTILGLLCSATHAGVNSLSGVTSVLKNGSALSTPVTCTFGITTACTDETHNTNTYTTGDVISVQTITQAAEVLAGLNCVVEIN